MHICSVELVTDPEDGEKWTSERRIVGSREKGVLWEGGAVGEKEGNSK